MDPNNLSTIYKQFANNLPTILITIFHIFDKNPPQIEKQFDKYMSMPTICHHLGNDMPTIFHQLKKNLLKIQKI